MRWLAGILTAFFVILILIILFGGHKAPKKVITGPVIQPLPTYANTDATVQWTLDGVVNGDESHRQIRITVGQSQRELDIIQGYSGHILEIHNYYNTPDAYRVFLKSIQKAGFVSKVKKPKVSNDPEGYCPLGLRYIYTLNQGGDGLSTLWASSCSTSVGNLGGSSSLLNSLFKAQIPDYSTVTQHVEVN